MNRKAMQLAISTIILLVIGVVILIAIIVAVTGGFDRLKGTTEPFTNTAEAIAVKDSCVMACENNVKISYCCDEREIDGNSIKCDDPRLDIQNCEITCEAGACNTDAS